MTITTVGIDLAKNVFAVHGVDQNGRTVLVKPKVSRAALPELIASLKCHLIPQSRNVTLKLIFRVTNLISCVGSVQRFYLGVSLEIGNFCTLSGLFNQSWFVRG